VTDQIEIKDLPGTFKENEATRREFFSHADK